MEAGKNVLTSRINFSKVDEQDPAFANHLQSITEKRKEKAKEINNTSIFGGALLTKLDRIDQLSEVRLMAVYKTDDRDAIKSKEIEQSRARLDDLREIPSLLTLLVKATPEYFNRPQTEKEEREATDYFDPRSLDILDREKVPDEIYVKILQRHAERMSLYFQEFINKVPQLRQRMIDLLEESEITRYVDSTKIKDRLTNVTFTPADIIEMTVTGTAGDFRVSTEEIRIDASYSDEMRERVLIHESLHAVSGRTILKESYPAMRNGKAIVAENIATIRGGLRIEGLQDPYGLEDIFHFSWLDEAITENLAEKIIPTDQTNNSFYHGERELFELLLQKGEKNINPDLAIAAYFENFDPSKPPGERIPAWKSFYKAVNDAYAPGFLTKLDAYILSRDGDVTDAVGQMKKDWRVIMNAQTPAKIESKLKKEAATLPPENSVTELVQ